MKQFWKCVSIYTEIDSTEQIGDDRIALRKYR